jgi:hypothetical protein
LLKAEEPLAIELGEGFANPSSFRMLHIASVLDIEHPELELTNVGDK